MSDDDFAAEVRAFQAARWRESRLQAHARDHRDDFVRILGKALSAEQLDELSQLALRSWDRLFTGLGLDESVVYNFVGSWSASGGTIVAVVRGKVIRTCIPFRHIDEWLNTHREIVEVTDRARGLGL